MAAERVLEVAQRIEVRHEVPEPDLGLLTRQPEARRSLPARIQRSAGEPSQSFSRAREFRDKSLGRSRRLLPLEDPFGRSRSLARHRLRPGLVEQLLPPLLVKGLD